MTGRPPWPGARLVVLGLVTGPLGSTAAAAGLVVGGFVDDGARHVAAVVVAVGLSIGGGKHIAEKLYPHRPG